MRLAALSICALTCLSFAPANTAAQRTLSLPSKGLMRLQSPDHHWELIAPPEQLDGEYQLVLLNRRTRKRSVVKTYVRSLKAAWNQDGTAFYTNEAPGSNIEEASLFLPRKGHTLSLNDVVLDRDLHAAANARDADHLYFHAIRWLKRDSLLIEFCGHGDKVRFDYLWKMTLAGSDGRYIKLNALTRVVEPLRSSEPDCKY